jgi:bifunctional DNase/RNase
LDKVEVWELREDTYYALIHLTYKGKEMAIDARPSDAIALSLRMNAPFLSQRRFSTNPIG